MWEQFFAVASASCQHLHQPDGRRRATGNGRQGRRALGKGCCDAAQGGDRVQRRDEDRAAAIFLTTANGSMSLSMLFPHPVGACKPNRLVRIVPISIVRHNADCSGQNGREGLWTSQQAVASSCET